MEQANGGSVADVTAIDPSIPSDMKSFIQSWDANTQAAAKSVCTVAEYPLKVTVLICHLIPQS